MEISANIYSAFAAMIGKRCCRQRVGLERSLSIGFGEKVYNLKYKAVDPYYGEWEIGTYTSAWRITKRSQIVCGSSDVVDSINELDEHLQTIKLGTILAIESFSPFDIRIKLDDEMCIEFMRASAEDDEIFHIFGPENLYVEYKCHNRWKVGKSNNPWS